MLEPLDVGIGGWIWGQDWNSNSEIPKLDKGIVPTGTLTTRQTPAPEIISEQM